MSKRINVMLSDEMNLKLDSYADRYGISKSSIVGFLVGQWVDNMDRMNNTVFGATGKEGILADVLKQAIQSEEDLQK
jgi:hypothetical protein